VTEQRELSEELEKTRRMEALGSLAGGVAHDFNNLLMVIQSCTDLAVQQLPAEHPAQTDLVDVSEAVRRAAALTQQLLTFARRQVLPPTQGSIVARTARELAPILTRLCSKNIEFVLDAEHSQLGVDANSLQIEQLLLNLSANACDAMPLGGKLRVTVCDRELAAEEVPGLAAGAYVEITVADTGQGISPEVQERMFEPFYTTKPPGRGTGLGLATVFGLVTQLRGRISVVSNPGEGASFQILLPAAGSASAPLAEPVEPQPSLDVLLVDDEAIVRSSIARMLSNAGHHVTEADAVEAALDLARVPDAHFDAIVTDVVIGSGDGLSMLERLRDAQPEAAVVVISGFIPSPERVAAVAAQGAEFLHKPFSNAALLAALDRARAGVRSRRS
jgi:CheY-like chemotaxis protein/two-component sensor histidine kinase